VSAPPYPGTSQQPCVRNTIPAEAAEEIQTPKFPGFPHQGKIVGLIALALGVTVFAWAVYTHHLNREAHTLYSKGSASGDHKALGAARERFADLLRLQPRALVPLDWAATEGNLGTVLTALGQRERETARLEEAVAAHRAALEERSHERVPLEWAATQGNLAAALRVLGEREGGTARLEEAVAAYRAALQ